MNPIYEARIARVKAESEWKAVDREPSSTTEQRTAARKTYDEAKSNYLAAFKRARALLNQANGRAG